MESERPKSGLTSSQRRRLYAQEARRRKRRKRLLVGLVAGLAVGGALVGYFALGGSSSEDAATQLESSPPATTTAHPPTTTAAQHPAPRPAPRALFTPADRANFANLERRLGGTSGVTVSGVGLGRPVSELGTLQEGVAWSTIKVPIAVAIEARFGGAPPSATQDLLRRAITASDNAAAEALWSALGAPDVAGAAVQRVLASTGDTSTRVE